MGCGDQWHRSQASSQDHLGMGCHQECHTGHHPVDQYAAACPAMCHFECNDITFISFYRLLNIYDYDSQNTRYVLKYNFCLSFNSVMHYFIIKNMHADNHMF